MSENEHEDTQPSAREPKAKKAKKEKAAEMMVDVVAKRAIPDNLYRLANALMWVHQDVRFNADTVIDLKLSPVPDRDGGTGVNVWWQDKIKGSFRTHYSAAELDREPKAK